MPGGAGGSDQVEGGSAFPSEGATLMTWTQVSREKYKDLLRWSADKKGSSEFPQVQDKESTQQSPDLFLQWLHWSFICVYLVEKMIFTVGTGEKWKMRRL